MGEWPTLSLREANVTLIDCDHRTPPASEAGYPYVAIPQLRGGRIDLSHVRHIKREHFVDWTRKAKPSANDVILSRRCNPGETAVVPLDLEFALGQNLVLLRSDGSKVYPPFLRWLVRGPEWWHQISKFLNVGAVFNSLRCADVPNFELCIPPLPEQHVIAHILGTLDDKIELNRRMNETLERTVDTVFRRLAHRAEDRPASPIYDFAEVVYGAAFASARFNGSGRGLPLIRIRDLVDHAPDVFTDEEHPRATVIHPGDIVVGMDGEFRAHIWQGRTALLNQRVCSFRPRSGVPHAFVWKIIQEPLSFYEQAKTGTTVIHLGKRDIDRFEVTGPTPQDLKEFGRVTDPLVDRMVANAAESRTLAALRDVLLPKLISGELRIRDVERGVELEPKPSDLC